MHRHGNGDAEAEDGRDAVARQLDIQNKICGLRHPGETCLCLYFTKLKLCIIPDLQRLKKITRVLNFFGTTAPVCQISVESRFLIFSKAPRHMILEILDNFLFSCKLSVS